jgi:hypothetical protein
MGTVESHGLAGRLMVEASCSLPALEEQVREDEVLPQS